MPRALTFRDHILKSVVFDDSRTVHLSSSFGLSVLVLARYDIKRVLVCECHENHAICNIVEDGRAPTLPIECNDTDHVTALWSRA